MSLSVEKQHFFKYKFSLDFANVQRFSEQTKESRKIIEKSFKVACEVSRKERRCKTPHQ